MVLPPPKAQTPMNAQVSDRRALLILNFHAHMRHSLLRSPILNV
jgi:hypothetical protein